MSNFTLIQAKALIIIILFIFFHQDYVVSLEHIFNSSELRFISSLKIQILTFSLDRFENSYIFDAVLKLCKDEAFGHGNESLASKLFINIVSRNNVRSIQNFH